MVGQEILYHDGRRRVYPLFSLYFINYGHGYRARRKSFPQVFYFSYFTDFHLPIYIIRIFKAGLKLDTFYTLIAKENASEDNVDGVGNATIIDNDLENSKTALEVLHGFSDNSNFFFSYLCRTLIEFAIASVLLFWLTFLGKIKVSIL